MRTSAPPLLPLLRSQVQGKILALLYLHPDGEYSLTSIASQLGVSIKTVHHEVSRLTEAGFVTDRRVGRARLVRAELDSPVARPLTDLLTVTYGPVPVLSAELSSIEGIDRALIYGSWAARHEGEPGHIPNDVDVLVAGTADLDELDDAAGRASRRLHRPVNIRRVSVDAMVHSDDPFLTHVRSRPTVDLDLGQVAT